MKLSRDNSHNILRMASLRMMYVTAEYNTYIKRPIYNCYLDHLNLCSVAIGQQQLGFFLYINAGTLMHLSKLNLTLLLNK